MPPTTEPPPAVELAPKPEPIALIDIPDRSTWSVTASAIQEEGYEGPLACDGKTDTRWSSPSADPQWLQIDLGKPATLCGLSILWETAYANEYAVQGSLDGTTWTDLYQTAKGDGCTDEIYFQPALVRFVKIVGTRRATGWGYSIFEVNLKGPSESVIAEAPAASGSNASRMFDGRLDTSWRGAAPGPVSIQADLRQEKAIGGIRVEWGTNRATQADFYISRDGSTWVRMGDISEATGNFDLFIHPRAMARYLRLDIKTLANPALPPEIREISLRGPDENLSPAAQYEIAAEKAPAGWYPLQLRRQQVYWTVVGLPGDHKEALIDEYGNIEPSAGSPSLMPYVFTDGELRSALDAKTLTQALDDGYIPQPSVTWDLGGLKLTIEAMAWGGTDDSLIMARYRLLNESRSPKDGRFFLAVRPVQVNPPWQYGGLSPIRSLEYAKLQEGGGVRVNGQDMFVALTPPDAFGARPFEQGDVVRELARGQLPAAQKMENAGDQLSGAMAFDFSLPPGGQKDVVVAMPLFNNRQRIQGFMRRGMSDLYPSPSDAFTAHLQNMHHFWVNEIDKVVLQLGDRDIANTLKSQMAYILINRDGPAIQPGSRNYKRCWIRDGALTCASMLRMGLVEPVREYIDWYAARVQPDGLVPPILNNDGTLNTGFGSNLEYDSQGEFVFAIMEYYRFTGDRDFLKKYYPKIKLALEYLVKLREQTLAPNYMAELPAPERFAGILPKSISHEGYSPPMHSYWDDFFALKGWKDGQEAATLLGDQETAAWAEKQYGLLRDSVRASIEKTIAFKKIDFIPGCAEKGDMDASSTTIAFFPCGEGDLLPTNELLRTYDRYYADVVQRREPGWRGNYTPYEARNISAFLDLGQKDRALFLLNYLMDCRRPLAWNHLAEVVLGDYRMGSYIGDMPHTWVGSSLVNAVRDMIVAERNGKAILLDGVPEKWVRERGGIKVENFPTYFGSLNMSARLAGRTLTMKLNGTFNPPAGIEVRWPVAGTPTSVIVDGYRWTEFNDKGCTLNSSAREIIAEWAQ
ncbi:MAG TPA: discoidin domain-containing protein [Kiritimatiellia bacterium]|nr:discoidin domain-containing protein [Kiritimatiellia bacterium]